MKLCRKLELAGTLMLLAGMVGCGAIAVKMDDGISTGSAKVVAVSAGLFMSGGIVFLAGRFTE